MAGGWEWEELGHKEKPHVLEFKIIHFCQLTSTNTKNLIFKTPLTGGGHIALW